MWETIELREIKLFLVLAEELHFGRTADRLGITQSRVSQSLRAFEHKVGGQLVHRTSRHVSLTPLGARLREEVSGEYDGLLRALEHTHRRTQALAGELRVGLLSPTTGGPRFNAIVRTFEERHRASSVSIIDLSFDDPFGPLRRGEIDLMAARLPVTQPDLVVGPTLSREPRVLAVARDHPLAQRESVSLEDIGDYEVQPLTEEPEELMKVFVPRETPSGRPIRRRRAGWKPRTSHEVIALVARGVIVHPTVPSFVEYFGHPDIVLVPIVDLPASSSGLVWRRRTADPRVRAFIQTTRDVLAESSAGTSTSVSDQSRPESGWRRSTRRSP